jgi:hypothetical protein
MLNEKTVSKIQKLAKLYIDSYERFDLDDNEWQASKKQGVKLIVKALVQLGKGEDVATLLAINVFDMYAKGENWCPYPEKDPRGTDWARKFERALYELGICYSVRDYGRGGKTFSFK